MYLFCWIFQDNGSFLNHITSEMFLYRQELGILMLTKQIMGSGDEIEASLCGQAFDSSRDNPRPEPTQAVRRMEIYSGKP